MLYIYNTYIYVTEKKCIDLTLLSYLLNSLVHVFTFKTVLSMPYV